MSDITKRLDELVFWSSGEPDATVDFVECKTLIAARDEINRLREANQKWLEYSQREIEPELKDQVAELTAECRRLRAALQDIMDLAMKDLNQDVEWTVNYIYDKAREALGGDE